MADQRKPERDEPARTSADEERLRGIADDEVDFDDEEDLDAEESDEDEETTL
jgi:hypothetical protein